MEGIPPAQDTDAEDVAWALQTADALWKRNERIDAIVWLRRAAQAAGEAEDDDRALMLARNAAELSDWVAHNSGTGEQLPSSRAGAISQNPGGVDDLLQASISDLPTASHVVLPAILDRPSTQSIDIEMPIPEPAPSAAEVHAGMLNPWAASDDEGFLDAVTAVKPKPVRQPVSLVANLPRMDEYDDDEVVTSAREMVAITGENRIVSVPPVMDPLPPPSIEPVTASMMEPPVVHTHAPLPPPLPPPRRPPVRRIPLPRGAELDSEQNLEVAPPVAPPAESPPVESPEPEPPSYEPPAAPRVIETKPGPPPMPPAVETKPGPPAVLTETLATGLLDLSAVDAFADLPDDARDDFGRAAKLQTVERGEEISGFALAFLIQGSADVAATIVDAVAERIEAGTVLRSRGSVADSFPIRLVAATPTAVIATWDDASVAAAFHSCPWVEEDLRAAADRMQALVGITMGPLAQRLDPSLRHELMARLKVRFLSSSEVLVEQGKVVPGLLLVGVGELQLLVGEEVRGTVGAGEFIFADAILGGGVAPMTARATSEGAVILHADRKVAQELLVTCPPLLEIFAGM